MQKYYGYDEPWSCTRAKVFVTADGSDEEEAINDIEKYLSNK